jgi:hypothetical protein
VTALVTERLHSLAATLADLKVRVRAAIASELGGAVGAAVRDVLVATLTHRLVAPDRSPSAGRWRDEDERDHWGEPRPGRDPWDADPERIERHSPARSSEEIDAPRAVPAAAAVAVAVHVGRWWLSHRGGLVGAIAAGVLVTALGLASGPVARAALAVLAATADVLTGGSALPAAPPDPD